MNIRINRHYLKLLVIIILAFLVGAVIFFSFKPKKMDQQKTSVPTPIVKPTSKSPDIIELLSNYPLNASEEAKVKYRQLIHDQGKEVSKITFNDCKPNPSIILSKQSDTLTFINEDDMDHTLTITLDKSLDLPKKSSASVSLNFKNGAGLYSITCDSTNIPMGIFLITP